MAHINILLDVFKICFMFMKKTMDFTKARNKVSPTVLILATPEIKKTGNVTVALTLRCFHENVHLCIELIWIATNKSAKNHCVSTHRILSLYWLLFLHFPYTSFHLIPLSVYWMIGQTHSFSQKLTISSLKSLLLFGGTRQNDSSYSCQAKLTVHQLYSTTSHYGCRCDGIGQTMLLWFSYVPLDLLKY